MKVDQRNRAMRGWLVEPPPVPAAGAPPPSHRYKWHKMMGATNLLPDEEREAIRQASRRHVEEIQAAQVASDAVRVWPTGPALQIADRYAAGRKHA